MADDDTGPTLDSFGLDRFLPGGNGGDEQRPSSPGGGLNQSSLGGNGGVEQRPNECNNVSPDPIEEGNAFRFFSNPVGRSPYQQDPRVEEATDDDSMSSHDGHESSLARTFKHPKLSAHGPHSKSSSLNMSYSSDTLGNRQGYNFDPNLLQ